MEEGRKKNCNKGCGETAVTHISYVRPRSTCRNYVSVVKRSLGDETVGTGVDALLLTFANSGEFSCSSFTETTVVFYSWSWAQLEVDFTLTSRDLT